MTIKQLLTIADRVYPDHTIARVFDLESDDCPEREDADEVGRTDTLALFIGRELKSTFEPVTDDHTEEDQLDEAVRVMRNAERDLCKVADTFIQESCRLDDDEGEVFS